MKQPVSVLGGVHYDDLEKEQLMGSDSCIGEITCRVQNELTKELKELKRMKKS